MRWRNTKTTRKHFPEKVPFQVHFHLKKLHFIPGLFRPPTFVRKASMASNSIVGPLLTDLYQLHMAYAYWKVQSYKFIVVQNKL